MLAVDARAVVFAVVFAAGLAVVLVHVYLKRFSPFLSG